MTDVFFFVKSLMGIKLGWKKLTNKNMFLGQGSYPNQKVFQYDERSHDMIRSDWKKIIFVKSLMGRKLESIFFMHKIDRKDASYGLVSVTMHYNYIKCFKDIPNSHGDIN